MLFNKLQFVLDSEANSIGENLGSVRRLSNLSTIVELVAPFDTTQVVSKHYLFADSSTMSSRMILATKADGSYLRGKDVVDPSESYFDEVKDYYVWQRNIKAVALSKISKFRAGKVTISFQEKEIILDPEALFNKGTIGATADIQDVSTIVAPVAGDYYICDDFEYIEPSTAIELTLGEAIYFDGTDWFRGSKLSITKNSANTDIAVDPSVVAKQDLISKEDPFTQEIVDDLNRIDTTILSINNAIRDGRLVKRVDGKLVPGLLDNEFISAPLLEEYIDLRFAGFSENSIILETYPTKAAFDAAYNSVDQTLLLLNGDTIRVLTGNRVSVVSDESINGNTTIYQFNGVNFIITSTSDIPVVTEINDGLFTSEDYTDFIKNRTFTFNAWDESKGKIKPSALPAGAKFYAGDINAPGQLPGNLTAAENGYTYYVTAPFEEPAYSLGELNKGDEVVWNGNLQEFAKHDNTESVTTVNGEVGNVILDAVDILTTSGDTIEDELIRIEAASDAISESKLDDSQLVSNFNNPDDLTIPTTKAVDDRLDTKSSKLNNNSATSKVFGFGVNDFTQDDLDTYSYNAAGVKFVRTNLSENDGIPITFGRFIKAGTSTNPLVATSFYSSAYLFEDFSDLITQADIDNNGANLITDLALETQKFIEFGAIPEGGNLIGQPKVKIGYTTDFPADDIIDDIVFIALFEHLDVGINKIQPFGLTSTQALKTVSQYSKGKQVYIRSGNDIVGSSTNSFGLNRLGGTVFGSGFNFGGVGNQNIIKTNLVENANIVKVYPDGADGFTIDTNNGNFYSEIDPEEYFDLSDNTVKNSGIGGTETLVGLVGYSIADLSIIIYILPQTAGDSDTDSETDMLFDSLRGENGALQAISAGQIDYSNIGLLENPLFRAVSFLAIEHGVSDISTDTDKYAFVPVTEVGGTVSFSNSTGELAADSVINPGVVGFNNQQALNIELNNKDIFHSTELVRIESKVDTNLADISTIVTRINTQREFVDTSYTGDGSTKQFDYNIGYEADNVITITVGGIEFTEGQEYDLIDLTGGTLRVEFSDNEIPTDGYTIKLRQVKKI